MVKNVVDGFFIEICFCLFISLEERK